MIFLHTLVFAVWALPASEASRRRDGRTGHQGAETCEFYNPTSEHKAYKMIQKMRHSEAQFLRRSTYTEHVDITVNLHASVPSNASCDIVPAIQIYKQFEVLREECMYSIRPVKYNLS